MNKFHKYKPVLLITPWVVILDHLTKWLIVSKLQFGESVPVIPNFFDIVYVLNTGAAFGMFADMNPAYREIFFYIVSTIAFYFLYSIYHKSHQDGSKLHFPIAFIVGGAIGNIVDRAMRGAVVDFLSFHWYDQWMSINWFGQAYRIHLSWPAFNVADIAISFGVICLLIKMYRAEKALKKNLQGRL